MTFDPASFHRNVAMRGAIGLLAMACGADTAFADPCAGGDLSIQATSEIALSALGAYNVGQSVSLAAQATGITVTAHSWAVQGDIVKDYTETVWDPFTASPVTFSVTAVAPADLTQPTLEFYWKPSAAQIYPSNGGPEVRDVTLTATSSGGTICVVTMSLTVERNETDPARQPNDFYTSGHRAPNELNVQKGGVIDEHQTWHLADLCVGMEESAVGFLPWHGEFLRHYDLWRAEFGYPPVRAWYPGTPLPTDVGHQHAPRLASYTPADNRIPYGLTLTGPTVTTATVVPPTSLSNFTSNATFSNYLEFASGYHGLVHCNIGPNSFGGMCAFSSPKDPMFWRWHGFIDQIYRNYCFANGLATNSAFNSGSCEFPVDQTADVWMADNAADIANQGVPPSSPIGCLSPDIWNRTSAATCMPDVPVPGEARDCGSSADHQNPIAGLPNYLYATIHNLGPGAREIDYLELPIYVTAASTGLSWPVNFGRPLDYLQTVTMHVPAGGSVDVGPIVWMPPNPTPADHFCTYARLQTRQDPIDPPEVASLDTNTELSNDVAWRNMTIMTVMLTGSIERPAFRFDPVRFIFRPSSERGDATLRATLPRALLAEDAKVFVRFDDRFARWAARNGDRLRIDGKVEPVGRSVFLLRGQASTFSFPEEAFVSEFALEVGMGGTFSRPFLEPILFEQLDGERRPTGGVAIVPTKESFRLDG